MRPIIEHLQRQGIVGVGALTEALNERGYTTARGRQWYPSTVRRLLVRLGEREGSPCRSSYSAPRGALQNPPAALVASAQTARNCLRKPASRRRPISCSTCVAIRSSQCLQYGDTPGVINPLQAPPDFSPSPALDRRVDALICCDCLYRPWPTARSGSKG